MSDKIDWKAPLIERNKLSLGRLAFWATFIMSSISWVQGQDSPETLTTTLMVLLSYQLGKKVRNIAEIYVSNKSSAEKPSNES